MSPPKSETSPRRRSPRYRRLVRCGSCFRQFDAGTLAPGEQFHCHCGATLRVPKSAAQEAPVVRCAACGAPRAAGAGSCTFCSAPFVLGESARNPLCPVCASRVGDDQRFCHGCGTLIVPEAVAGQPTDLACPACKESRRLSSRRIASATTPLAMLECAGCGGIWLGHRTFDLLQERARREATPPSLARTAARREQRSKSVAYRPCPACRKLMARRNFGASSGVVVDVCGADGLWFDAAELDAVLAWIRGGGLERAAGRAAEERRESVRRETLRKREIEETERAPESGGHWLDLLGDLVDFVMESVRRR
jgi:Zn-finger nucleic acid-binding protein